MSRLIAIEDLATCTPEQAQEYIATFGLYTRTLSLHPAFGFVLENPDPRITNLFLDLGLDMKQANIDNPYIFAIRNKNPAIILLLLDRGIELKNVEWLLEHAINWNHEPNIDILLTKASPRDRKVAMAHALRCHRTPALINRIVKIGIDLYNFDPDAIVPVLFRLIEIPQTLVGCKVNFNITDRVGANVCHWITRTRLSVTSLVFAIQNGADATALDDEGYRPLHVCYFYRTEMPYFVVFFLAGADFTECIDKAINMHQLEQTDQMNILLQLSGTEWDVETKDEICARSNAIVRDMCTDICIALQSLELPALLTCEILQAHCCMWPRIPFHCFWNLVTMIKHFHNAEHAIKKRRVADD